MNKITAQQLKFRQNMPLWMKVEYSKKRIRSWYEHWQGQVYVSFSGGKDSTVLLDLVRKIYPDVPAVFVNTGQEYAEIIRFVKSIDNVIWLKPKMTFWEVVEKYGWPVVSKEVSMGISRYRNTKCPVQKKLRLNGGVNPTSGKKQNRSIPLKWQYLIDAPFKISERCCDILKKEPLKRYGKQSGRKAIIGQMTNESRIRKLDYMKHGCNAFYLKHPSSKPLAFWLEQDILYYIIDNELAYSAIYGDIIRKGGALQTTKEKRTGCKYCLFGAHLESEPGRFQRMAINCPGQHDLFVNKKNGKLPLETVGIKY